MAEPRRGRLAASAYLAAAAPCAVPSSLPISCLIAVALVAWGVERSFEGPRRHLGGALYAGFVVLAMLYARGFGVAWAAGAVLLPPALGAVAAARSTRARELLRGRPISTALGGILVLLLAYQGLFLAGALPPMTDDFLFALRADEVPEALLEEERAGAVAIVDAVRTGAQPPAAEGRLAQRHEHRTYVTLYAKGRRTRGHAEAGPLAEALGEATRAALAATRRPGDFSGPDASVQVDLAGPEDRLRHVALREAMRKGWMKAVGGRPAWRWLVYDGEPGLDGMVLRAGDEEGVLLPGDALVEGLHSPRSVRRRYRSHNVEDALKVLSRRTRLPWTGDAWPKGDLSTFRTRSFVRLPGSTRIVQTYRGNVLEDELPDEARLLKALDEAGRWLLRTVEEDGRFDYEYFPHEDRHGSGYNEVRHAGSVYGLFHMARLAAKEPSLSGADEYTEAGLLALDRVYRNLGAPPGKRPGDGYTAFLEGSRGEATNSGAAALTLLSFLERPTEQHVRDEALRARLRRDGDDELMAGLVRTLLAMIDEQGKVYRLFTEAARGGGVDEEPLYFPGEVMLALARYHAEVGSEEALEGARAIARNQVRKLKRPSHVPDHWVMQALEVLDRLDPQDPTWAEAAYEMGRRYVRDQFPPHPAPFPDYRGAYRRVQEVPRTTRAASRGEAVGGVARIAWRRGDPSEHFERALVAGARHLIEQQWRPENSWFLPDPQEARGAIRMGIVDMHCRIDNNQHAVVALGNALEALRRPGVR